MKLKGLLKIIREPSESLPRCRRGARPHARVRALLGRPRQSTVEVLDDAVAIKVAWSFLKATAYAATP